MRITKPGKVHSKKSPRKSASKKKRVLSKKSGKAKKKAVKPVHVAEKKPVFKPEPDKLDVVRQTVITTLWQFESLPPDEVRELVQQKVAESFSEEFASYFEYVFRLLMRHRLLEVVPDRIPVHIRLAQRLDE